MNTTRERLVDFYERDPYKQASSQGKQSMLRINLVLKPIPPVVDPCKSKEAEDRPFTQQEIARALADLLDFVSEQEVFEVSISYVESLHEAPISPITE